MQLGNRVFPYPVLNKNDNLSDYKESSTFNTLSNQLFNLISD